MSIPFSSTLSSSSSAFLVPSSSFVSATSLQNPSTQRTTSGSPSSEPFAQLFARSQADADPRADVAPARRTPGQAAPDRAASDRAAIARSAALEASADRRVDERAVADQRAEADDAAPPPSEPARQTISKSDHPRDTRDTRHERSVSRDKAAKDEAHEPVATAETATQDPASKTDAPGLAKSTDDPADKKADGVTVEPAPIDGAATQVIAVATLTVTASIVVEAKSTASTAPAPIGTSEAKTDLAAATAAATTPQGTGAADAADAAGPTAQHVSGPSLKAANTDTIEVASKGDDAVARVDPNGKAILPALPNAAPAPVASGDVATKAAPSEVSGLSSVKGDIKALGAALKAGSGGAPAAANTAVSPQGFAAFALDAPQSAEAAPVTPTLSTTLAALPVAIGSRALGGVREFTIHLYPAELGKVEVKLEIGDKGDIRAKLTVDRIETLHLLQRDAHTLHQALEQAGFKPPENGVQVSLRQDGQQQSDQRQSYDQARSRPGWQDHAADDEPASTDVTVAALTAYARRGNRALDIHI